MKPLHLANTQELTQMPNQPNDLFHRVNRILPEDQIVTKVPPETKAREAISLMEEKGYSQLPVVEGTEVLGIFSFRSFVLGTLKLNDRKIDPGELTVLDFAMRVQTFVSPVCTRITEHVHPS